MTLTREHGGRRLPIGSVATAAALLAAVGCGSAALAQKAKNWTPPPGKLQAQTIVEGVMKGHPDLILIGLHGVPPGSPAKAYTMIGSSYPDRVGNADDPDDMMVSEGGITILEPPHADDAAKEFGYMAPLHDGGGKIVGSIVLGFRNGDKLTDAEVLQRGNAIRADVERRVPDYAGYFRPAA